MDIKAEFKRSFYAMLKGKYKQELLNLSDGDKVSRYNGRKFNSLTIYAGLLFVIKDEELYDYINRLVEEGISTKEEIAESFKIANLNVMNYRVKIMPPRFRYKYLRLLVNIKDTYPEVKEYELIVEEIDPETKLKIDVGYAQLVKDLSGIGLDKQQICESLEINPSSFEKYPLLDKKFREGRHKKEIKVVEGIVNDIFEQVINTNFFGNELLPALKQASLGRKIQLTKTIQINAKTVKTEILERYIKPDKDAVRLMLQLAGAGFLEDFSLDSRDVNALENIPVLGLESFNPDGSAKPLEITKYTDVEVIGE